MCAGDQFGQARIGQAHEAARRDAVGLVVEFLRPHLVEIVQDVLVQQARVQFGHAVDGEAAHRRQIGHADHALRLFFDQRHAPHPILIAGEAGPHLLQKAVIDLVDDFQMARQQRSNTLTGHFSSASGIKRVAGVGKRSAGDVPRLIPAQAVFVEQHAHQFGNGDDGMRVVQLNHGFVRELRASRH